MTDTSAPPSLEELLGKLKDSLGKGHALEHEAEALAKNLPDDVLKAICDDTHSRPHMIHQAPSEIIKGKETVLREAVWKEGKFAALTDDQASAVTKYTGKIQELMDVRKTEEGVIKSLSKHHPDHKLDLNALRNGVVQELKQAAIAAENATNPVVTKSFVGRNWGKMAGAAAVVAAGGWALNEMNKRSEAEKQPKQL